MSDLGTSGNPLRIAIVGSGPSGFYAAEALLQSKHVVEVDVLERLPVPYGLVRHGVAPDHPRLKDVADTYATIAQDPRFSFIGNVTFGEDVFLDDLKNCYHAAIFATGAATDRKLNIPGKNLAGVHPATSFVGWYNGHPDFRDLRVDLSGESAVIIGQGNVAIDVCRILARSADELRKTDIAAHSLEVLAESRIREIHLIGRRGPVQARFTTKELRELGQLAECAPYVDPDDLLLNETSQLELGDVREPARAKNLELFRNFSSPSQEKRKRCRFHFLCSPSRALGTTRLQQLVLERNRLFGPPGRQEAIGTGEFVTLAAELMICSVGYRGTPLAGLPFDDALGTLPHANGRISVPADALPLYAAGWIKRGPSEIIGTNRADSVATVTSLLEDMARFPRSSRLGRASLLPLLKTRSVSFDDWRSIDAAEKERGEHAGKPREKFTTIAEMLAACELVLQPRFSKGLRSC